ncbi:MAG: energy transducer TonB, partial [Caulobacteraceae bacterium]
MARRRINMTPALAASLALHGGVAAIALISWNLRPVELKIGPVVPVMIVDGPPADLRPTVQAPEPAEAQAENPEPLADPTPQAPEPAPVPTPPKAAVAPAKPQPLPVKPAPAPSPTGKQKPQPAQAKAKPADKPLDLDALAASLSNAISRKARPSGATQGPNRPAAAAQAQQGAGDSDRLSASEVDALRSKLEKLWNPNCEVEGGAGVIVTVGMRLNANGSLAGAPQVVS